MKISMDKKYRTRGGKLVRVLCVDAPGDYPVIALVHSVSLHCYTVEGRYFLTCVDHELDLIEVDEAIDKPWSCADDVPFGAMFLHDGEIMTPLHISGVSIVFCTRHGQLFRESYLNLYPNYKWSTDGITWHTCKKEDV